MRWNVGPLSAGRFVDDRLVSATLLLGLFVAAGLFVVRFPAAALAVIALVAFIGALVVDLKVAFGLVFGFVLLQGVALNVFEDHPMLGRGIGYLDDALILWLAVLAPFRRSAGWKRLRPLWPVYAALAGALGLGALAAWLHGPLRAAIPLDAFSLSKGFLVLFAAIHLELTSKSLDRLLRGVTYVSVALALWGLADMVLPGLTRGWLPLAGRIAYRMDMRCLVSVFPHEGVSGWYFAAAACLPLASYFVLRRRLDLMMSILLVASAFLSYRRKPVVGFVFAFCAVLVLDPANPRRRRMLLGALALLVLLVPTFGDSLTTNFVAAYAEYVDIVDPMRNARNALYIVSWRIAMDYFPIGAGLGQFGGYVTKNEYSDFYVQYGLDRVWGLSSADPSFVLDAFYPHVLGALGAVGGLLYLAALAWPVRILVRRFRRGGDPTGQAVIMAALLVAFEAAVEAVVAPVYEASLSAFFVFALLGAALAATGESD